MNSLNLKNTKRGCKGGAFSLFVGISLPSWELRTPTPQKKKEDKPRIL